MCFYLSFSSLILACFEPAVYLFFQLSFTIFFRGFWCLRWWASDKELGRNWRTVDWGTMRLFPLNSSASSSSSLDKEQSNGVSNRARLYLNVYDLTPVNNYLYWFGLGIFHSGIEGDVLIYFVFFMVLTLEFFFLPCFIVNNFVLSSLVFVVGDIRWLV